MLDKLLKMAEGPLQEALAKSGTNPGPSTASAIEEVFGSLLQNQAKSGKMEAVMEMFSGKETAPNSPVVNNLSGDLAQGLASKLGIDSKQAMAMAATALPLLMNFFNKKVNDAPQANEDIMSSIAKSLQGGGNGGGLEDIMGSLLGGGNKGGGMDLGGLMDLGKGLFK
jgi:uncharacterized protein YidB (DUF937 family)